MTQQAPVQDIIDDRFIVEKTLGQGGMGRVLRVYDKKLSRRVALKMLYRVGCRSASLARFMREARILAQLESDYVARIMDVAIAQDGSPYIVIEYLEGETLRAYLAAHGPPSLMAAATYIREACDALHEAHELGILHRDIKPSNLFLAKRRDGGQRIKVLDFGIAKGISGGLTGGGLTDRSITLGTPRYIAPERLRRADATDRRSDVWALGAVLYELLAARPAFPASGVPAVVAQIASGKVPEIRAVRWDVAPEVSAIIRKCLHPEPAERFPTAQALADALVPYAMKPSNVSAVMLNVPTELTRASAFRHRSETLRVAGTRASADDTCDGTTCVLPQKALQPPAGLFPGARPSVVGSNPAESSTGTFTFEKRQRREAWLVGCVVLSSMLALYGLVTALARAPSISLAPFSTFADDGAGDATPITPDPVSGAEQPPTNQPLRAEPSAQHSPPPVDVSSLPLEATPPSKPTLRRSSSPAPVREDEPVAREAPAPKVPKEDDVGEPTATGTDGEPDRAPAEPTPPPPKKPPRSSILDGTELFDDIR